jgi:protein-S-isoprenylcysteine O-methyltransferase Ste14
MGDFPLAVLIATIWTYWIAVGAMVVRQRRRKRRNFGFVPEQRIERFMWLVWVPLVVAWIALPYLALTHAEGSFALPAFARDNAMYAALRWVFAAIAALCLYATARCWKRMGKQWRMDVSTAEPTELITDGLFRHIRHPIYAFSMLLMVASAVIVPTLPLIVIALIHLVLMNLKARNEERHLLATQGEHYRQYLARTGRFFPRGGT